IEFFQQRLARSVGRHAATWASGRWREGRSHDYAKPWSWHPAGLGHPESIDPSAGGASCLARSFALREAGKPCHRLAILSCSLITHPGTRKLESCSPMEEAVSDNNEPVAQRNSRENLHRLLDEIIENPERRAEI